MKVFTPAVTLCVISSVLLGSQAQAVWVYPVDAPAPPTINSVKTLHNPTLAQIQNAIAPHTRVDVIGTVDASSGGHLYVGFDDVRLNFTQAARVYWSGNDVWNGFVEVEAHRVELRNLKMQVADSSPGMCRGMNIYTPSTDVLITGCEFKNIADGLVADGEWGRIAIVHTKFLNCGDWASSSMQGGYGLFLEEDDDYTDNLRLKDVTVTLANTSDQHGIRISKVQNLLIDNCNFGANGKRSMWAYGVENMAVRNTTFNHGSVLFNLKPYELQTDRPTKHVRFDNCLINHSGILTPLSIFCGKCTIDFAMRDCDINSTTSSSAMSIAWRDPGNQSKNIRWFDGSIKFNGQVLMNMDGCDMSPDWTQQQLQNLAIGPIDDPR